MGEDYIRQVPDASKHTYLVSALCSALVLVFSWANEEVRAPHWLKHTPRALITITIKKVIKSVKTICT